mmetsp:Transcript_5139/g.9351  ORF Transcript_5139/g.9351 Transcript_5139/m.9351 type:complete len:83 (-) Transcript_5139:470-718(-)
MYIYIYIVEIQIRNQLWSLGFHSAVSFCKVSTQSVTRASLTPLSPNPYFDREYTSSEDESAPTSTTRRMTISGNRQTLDRHT